MLVNHKRYKNIFPKPTYTDIITHFNSCHPKNYIFSAVRYVIYRLNNYQLKLDAKEKELIIIQNIMHNKSFPLHIIPKLQAKERKYHDIIDSNASPCPKLVTFTFFGNEM